MKHYLRIIVSTTVVFYATTMLMEGAIELGTDPKNILFVIGGLIIISQLINPIFSLILLPINHLTFGIFSYVLNVALFFILPHFLSGFSINAYDFPGADINGFILPAVALTQVSTVLVVSAAITIIQKFLHLIFE